MPLIRHDPLPLTLDAFRELRLRLQQPYQHEIVQHEADRHLFVRVPGAEPDPVADMEEVARRLPEWSLTGITNVFLLGEYGRFHVPGAHLEPLLEHRRALDGAALDAFRQSLDPNYGIGLQRVPQDPAHELRLGVRVPRIRLSDLDESDLARVARAAGPLLETRQAASVVYAYLLSEADHVRLPAADFFEDITPRWRTIKATPVPEAIQVVPRPRPARILPARPVIDLEFHIDALSEAPPPAAPEPQGDGLRERLQSLGYEVRTEVHAGDTAFDLAAERAHAYPRRIVALRTPLLDRSEADRLLAAVRRAQADLLLVLTPEITLEAQTRLLASKVKVIRPAEVAQLSL